MPFGKSSSVTATDRFHLNSQIVVLQETPNYKILNKIKAKNTNINHDTVIIIIMKQN